MAAGLLVVACAGAVTVASAGPASASAGPDPILYVASTGLTAYDIVTHAVVATIPIAGDVSNVVVNASGTTAYTVGAGKAVAVVNTATNTIAATISLGQDVNTLALSPNGAELYVPYTTGAAVAVISTATNSVITTIPVGQYPGSVAFSPNGSIAYVTSFQNNTISVINTSTHAVTATIPVGAQPNAIVFSPDSSTAYLAYGTDAYGLTAGFVERIDTATSRVNATVTLGGDPFGIAMTPDGTAVYATIFNNNAVNAQQPIPGTTVAVVSTATFTVTANITVGTNPSAIILSPDGSTAYVSNFSSNTVSVINTATKQVTATIGGFTYPDGLALFTPGPTVTGVSPSNGPQTGGTTVTVAGSGLAGASAVFFGTAPATSFQVNSDRSITAVAPAAAGAGPVDVRVVTSAGTSAATSTDRYTYVASPPTVTAVSPNTGPDTGGTAVTITGTGFTGASAVSFGTLPAASFTVTGPTTITATAPAAAAGVVDVTVAAPAGTSAVVAADKYAYTASVPTVTRLSPTYGPASGGTQVTISGIGFGVVTSAGFAPEVSAVHFGTVAASFVVSGPLSLTVTTPPGADGTVDVTVTNPAGTSSTSAADRFSYLSVPAVTAISPAQGSMSGGSVVTVTGTGFLGASTVDFGATPASNVVVINDTSLTAVAPPAASAGGVDVTVTNPLGTSTTTSADRYAYVAAPVVTGVSPDAGPVSGGSPVAVTGSGFTGASAVYFGNAAASSFTVNSDGSITALAPPGSPGAVDVTVSATGGTSATTAADLYRYAAAPTVTGVAPNSGPLAGGSTVTISGTGFTGASAVTLGGIPTTSFTVNNDSSITMTTSAAPGAGSVDVLVTTPGGTSATGAADRYTYIAAPTVTGVSPNAGPLVGGTLVTVTGADLTGATEVDFGSVSATDVTVIGPTSLTAVAPAATAGAVDITVTTSGGTSSTSPLDRYNYLPAPTVTAIAPAAGPLAGGTTVTITGTNLDPAQGSTVYFGAVASTNVIINSDTSITATTPPGTAGTVDVTVDNPGGTSTTSAADEYTYTAAPAVTAVSPSQGPIVGGTTITITGSGFGSANAVMFGSTAAASFTVSGADSISAVAPAASSVGSVDVTVTTSGGTSATGAADAYTYMGATVTTVTTSADPSVTGQPATFTAAIAAVMPATGTPSGAVTFTIDGIAQVPVTLAAGSASITVSNLAAGTHTVSATYSGDADFTASTSSSLQQTIQQPTTTTLTVSPTGGSIEGAAVTMTATETPNTAGTMQFYDGASPLGAPIALTAAMGSVSYTTSALSVGDHSLSATFTPSTSAYLPSTSTPVDYQVAAPPPPFAIDQTITRKGTSTVTTAPFSTTGPRLLVAFTSSDGPATKQTTTVTGAGLTWTLAQRANAKGGTAEIWTAYATGPLADAAVTSTPKTGGYAQLLTVEAFTGASGIGAGAIASKTGGTPTVSVTTTKAGSWVFAVGEDYTRATTITPAAGQTVLEQSQDTVNGDTFWDQNTTAVTPTAGIKVTINDTSPSGDTWNLAAIEILPAN